MHEHRKEGESDLLDVGGSVELVDHVDGYLAGQRLQLDVVLQSAFGEQAVLNGEAERLEKLLLGGDAQEEHLGEVAAVRLPHPPQSRHVHLLGLAQRDRGLVSDDAEGACQLRVVHLRLAGALPPRASAFAQE